MSRQGNCWNNAVAESFFGILKMERFKKRICKNQEIVRPNIYEYIIVLYNPIHRHSRIGG